MLRLALRTVFAAFSLLLVAGCTGTTGMQPSSTGGKDEPISFQLVTDLPIPQGASRDDERSVVLSYRDRWVGKLVLKVTRPAGEVAAFYHQQMPGFGWEPVLAVTSNRSVLTYLRGDRAATIEIEAGTLYGALVMVTVGPRESSAASGAGIERVRQEPLR